MNHVDLMETETRAGVWLGRALAVMAIVIVCFWIGGGV